MNDCDAVGNGGGGGGGGEINTASNVGTAGVGVFKQKIGVDLKFKKINAGSNKIIIQDDTGDDEIDIDLDETKIPVANLIMARIAGSTFNSVQHIQDVFHSAGVTNSGSGFISDDADGTITVATGTGQIRISNSSTAQLVFTDWDVESGVNVALIDNDLNYIYVEYNSGAPRVIATITKRSDSNTNILLGNVYRDGIVLDITNENVVDVSDHALSMVLRLKATSPFAHESGAVISETGTRNIAITAGIFWQGLISFVTGILDTSVSDNFTYWYRDGAGGWTKVITQTQISNDEYDDNSGTLATLSNNQFGVHWVYLESDGELVIIYGQNSYNLMNAESALPPSTLPPSMEEHAFIVGKIIIGKDDSTFTVIESAFDVIFQGGLATDHLDLLNIGSNSHAVIDSHLGSSANPHSVTKDQVGLGAVENLKVNLVATTAPGVSNDNTEGYSVLSRWADVTADKEYVCLDVSTGAADWIETTGGGGGIVETSGTWTPTIQDSSLSDAEGQTYSANTGIYVKQGNLVHIQGQMTISSLGTLDTAQQARIAGVPFVSGSNNPHAVISFGVVINTVLTALTSITGYIQPSASYMFLNEFDATEGTSALPISKLTATSRFFFSATYRV